jgi:hypothetical protein
MHCSEICGEDAEQWPKERNVAVCSELKEQTKDCLNIICTIIKGDEQDPETKQ